MRFLKTVLSLAFGALLIAVAVLSGNKLLGTLIFSFLGVAAASYLLDFILVRLPPEHFPSEVLARAERRAAKLLLFLTPASVEGMIVFGAFLVVASTQLSFESTLVAIAVYVAGMFVLVILCDKLTKLSNQRHHEEHQRMFSVPNGT